MNIELTYRVVYAFLYLSALLIRVYYTRKYSPVVEKNFRKRWKKVAETEGTLSAVLWSSLSVFWISFALI